MPISVIQRLNEHALKDGRVKGKGELSHGPTSYDVNSEAMGELPELMETVTNEGVDPAIALRSGMHTPELADDLQDRQGGGDGTTEDNSRTPLELNYADNMIMNPQVDDGDNGVGDLLTGFEGMHVDRYSTHDEPVGSIVYYPGRAYEPAVSGAQEGEWTDHGPQNLQT